MKIVRWFGLICSGLLLLGCHHGHKSHELRIGAMSGPESELVEVAQQVAQQKYHLPIKIVAFDSYNIPNAALANGDIDANVFQHLPFLESQIKARGYKLVSIGKTFIYPMGIYSKTISSLAKLPENAKVAIPNDPTNEGRALLLLQKAGLLKLRPDVGYSATPLDIVANPKKLRIITLSAAQLPRSLDDVALAVINTTFASLIDLSPEKNALFAESADSPYANIIVVRKSDRHDPRFAKLVKALQSPAVMRKAKELFGDGAIPAWKPQT